MKAVIIVFMMCMAACLLVAGCTTPVPVTPTPTTIATPQPTASIPLTDSALTGNWALSEMGLQGGQAPLTIFPQPITITFTAQGTLAGYGGCNNYGGFYTLTGTSGPFGKTITIGPITSNMMYCVDTIDIETSYFQILSNVTSYGIDNNTTLSMRDPLGSTLVYQRT
jgi:heat shock protein HslJ